MPSLMQVDSFTLNFIYSTPLSYKFSIGNDCTNLMPHVWYLFTIRHIRLANLFRNLHHYSICRGLMMKWNLHNTLAILHKGT